MKHPAARTLWASTLLVIKASVRSFGANRNLQTAASLGFYGLLSLMPLLLITLILLRMVLKSSEQAADALGEMMGSILPAMSQNILGDINSITSGGALGVVGAGLMLWSMTPLSGALRTALARMFNMVQPQAFLKAKLLDLAAIFGLLALILANITLRFIFPPADSWADPLAVALSFLARTVVPSALSILFLGLLFRTFAPVRLTWRQWMLGAVCVTVLGALMRHLFVVLLAYNPNYGYAFGSLKALFVLIVWVYYSFAALLFGAEIMANTYRRDALLLRGLLEPAKARAGNAHSLLKKFERILGDGEVLFRENDAGSEMFVVLEGAIRISGSGRELVQLPEGRYFGEMSLLNGMPRTATATAAGVARLAVITKDNFDLLVRENPSLVRGLLEELARRLAETNRRVDEARG